MADLKTLHVYNLALQFTSRASQHAQDLPRGWSHLADQLKRASLSIVLNTAEGVGEYRPKEKARFYRMARRSGTECEAIMDAIVALGLVAEVKVKAEIEDVRRIQKMLTRMIVRVE